VLLEQEAEGMGLRRQEALFMEADGIWVSFQKRARKRGIKKKREIKLAVVHEGWQVRKVEKSGLTTGYLNAPTMWNPRRRGAKLFGRRHAPGLRAGIGI